VCTRDRPRVLDLCLAAVRRLRYPRLELVVVDSASTTAGTREVAERHGATLVRAARPGLSHARNVGVRASRSEIVAFLDDDAAPEPDWVDRLAPEFDDPAVMAVTGRSLPPGAMTAEERRVCALTQGPMPSERRAIDLEDPDWFEFTNFGGLGSGTNMAFRRSAFDRVATFDERLGRGTEVGGGEEHYLFFQIVDRGYRIVYQPSAVVVHPLQNSFDQLWSRYLADCTSATAYMTKLFFEQPRYRRRLVRYVGGALVGRERRWRAKSDTPRDPQRSRPGVLVAYARGPLRYASGRLAVRRP
jgi:cellulose synthase/poly-beta-1,6-N-acetylglucosamine synthase-like glycosyltransferase